MARLIVPRTVTVVGGEQSRSASLSDFRSERAYVLLGDPGAGKTEAFGAECEEYVDGKVVTARRFIRRGVDRLSEWEGKTLFIDGLDEVRAGSGDPRRSLDQILERLERLGSPGFRLSCRAVDWLGRNDLLGIVSEGGYADLRVLHLEPLTGADITRILVDLGVTDVADFLDEARDQGLEGLLDNPQLLGLLAVATRDGQWPENRGGTLALACQKLAQEWNDEHRAAHRNAPPLSTDRIISAAGHLSALSLLSGRDLVSLDSSDDCDHVRPEDIPDGDQPALMRAVKSNLFESHPDGGFVSPHRQLSEFLAAGFLRDRIEAGVPARRVMALMTGDDGVVVTELRGLSAWLATFDRASRLALVESDPVGVALYGDVSSFRGDEIEHLLCSLAERADEVQPWEWPTVALTSLINEHSVAVLTRYLKEEDRTEGRQRAVGLLLHALRHAAGARACHESLERTVKDATWDPGVRKFALRALLNHSEDEAASTLIRLLDDFRDGRVQDGDGDLMGALLNHLYPGHLGPTRIWDYLVPVGPPDYLGMYRVFWSDHLRNRTEGKHLVTLLRSLRERGGLFRGDLSSHWLRRMLQKLVSRALDTVGDKVTVSTFYDWLELIDYEQPESALAHTDEYQAVTEWLARRPELQKELALEGLNRRMGAGSSSPGSEPDGAGDQDEDDRSRAPAVYRAMQIKWTVFRAGKPDDFPAWSLNQAVATAETNPRMARILLHWSLPWDYDDSGPGLSIAEVRAATRDVPSLRDGVANLLEGQRDWEAHEARMRVREERDNEYLQERQRRQRGFVTYVRQHAVELQEGRCPPGLLHRIAVAYHDSFLDQRASTPEHRVLKLLQGHHDLVDAAMQGFRRVVDREDLPTLREVIRLNEQKQMSRFALPVLAGFDSSPDLLQSRRSAEVARAAAMYYLTPLNVPGHPEWYRWALDHRPEPIAEALLKVTRSRVRRRLDCNYLWDFARNGSYRDVVYLAAVPLLRAFPTRCTEPQISALHAVLMAALRWQVDGLAGFVEKRASKPDLDVSQRALWLTAGLQLSPEHYVPRIQGFLEDGEEARSRQVVRLLAPTGMERLPMQWDTLGLATMIRILGSRYAPWRPEGSGMASVVDEDRWKVEELISAWATTLASRTSRQAAELLHSLVDDPALEPWHYVLKGKRDEQVVARRGATFAVPHLHAVQQTLANAKPSSPADLTALVSDRLERLAREIRHGSTDDWRQYWNEDRHGHPTRPKREESCCKALLSALNAHLPDGVHAHRESVHSRDKRSDIRVFSDGHAIPIEIKKDSNRRLWSSVADQLVPGYTTAPESSGFGIYLVLWFGQGRIPLPPTGRRPKSPEELCARLEERLTGPNRHKISVVVVDVSATYK